MSQKQRASLTDLPRTAEELTPAEAEAVRGGVEDPNLRKMGNPDERTYGSPDGRPGGSILLRDGLTSPRG
jgi:hypothetical protein